MQHDSSLRPDDTEIIHQILDGHTDAFESLLIRYQELVSKIVRRHVPHDDITETMQDVFIRVFQSLPSFRAKGDFKHWLTSIAVRTCYDYWRTVYQSKETPISEITEKHQEWLESVIHGEHGTLIEEKGSCEEAKEILDWALAKLSAEDRIVLELIYLEGHTCKETAKLLGWSVANVKVRSFRSRKKLEKILSEVMGIY
ncbi:MAG: RNA polymerase sigma factor [Deltaproteobacteria bacterium]|nr:RNA polymerase sigma factor [Deltaproteobacteria bacterium]